MSTNDSNSPQELDPWMKKLMWIMTISLCVIAFVWLFAFPHPEAIQGFKNMVNGYDCFHLVHWMDGLDQTSWQYKYAKSIYAERGCTL